MTDRDGLLAAAARHDVVVAGQLVAAGPGPGGETEVVLVSLVAERLLGRLRLLRGGPACYWITGAGLAAIESQLPVPSFELGEVRRCVGAAWAAVRAGDGRFPGAGVLTARETVAEDLCRIRGATAGRPCGVRVAGMPAQDGSGLHHPDVLVRSDRGWVAVEVQLASLSARRMSALLTAYGADPRYVRVIFLVEEERIAREFEAAASALGLTELVSAQWMQWPAA